ncbi:MAG: DUF2330 domain-containing protein [Gemmataceae bacterium]
MGANRWLGGVGGILAAVLLLAPGAGSRTAAPRPAAPPGTRSHRQRVRLIWDAATKTEHFIRRGTFDTASPDFGFLVPTPSEPELAEADDALFDTLEEWTKPEERYARRPGGGRRCQDGHRCRQRPAAVTVLGEAGRRAGRRQAEGDRHEGACWSGSRSTATPAGRRLEALARSLCQGRRVITAFKIAKPAGSGATTVSTKPLRMTFQTDGPFYPYREPEDMRTPGAYPDRYLGCSCWRIRKWTPDSEWRSCPSRGPSPGRDGSRRTRRRRCTPA